MRFSSSLLLASLVTLIQADVRFTSPAAGASLPGGGSIAVQWTDSGSGPALTTFASYQLFLMAGGNDGPSMIQLAVLVPNGVYTTGNAAQGVITAGVGGSATNAYFLKMVSTSASGGQLINYSSRFTLTGMTGTFPAAVQAGITAAAGSSAGPATEDQLSNNVGAGAGDSGNQVPYSLQSGLTRYAPMQPVPPTKITQKTWTPLFPTSAFTVATTYLPVPSIVTTVTAKQTFSVSSIENTAAAASQPVVGGGNNAQARFLNRWKD
ncbi:putative cell wall synthesis protein KRE9 [Elsinoe fawcettii]|nr:putative cell wall synthesis protein KRE9 [Elsinoe fawcettii]